MAFMSISEIPCLVGDHDHAQMFWFIPQDVPHPFNYTAPCQTPNIHSKLLSHTHCGSKEDFELHILVNIFIVFTNIRPQCVYLHLGGTNTRHSLLQYPPIKINPFAWQLEQWTRISFTPLPSPKAFPDKT